VKKTFEQIVAEQFSTIQKTTRLRYPRQIQFSEEFMAAIEKEYYTQVLKESPEAPIRNRPEKFMKALKFVVTDLVKNESTAKLKYQAIQEDTEDYVATSPHSRPSPKSCCDDCKDEEKVLDNNLKKVSSKTRILKK